MEPRQCRKKTSQIVRKRTGCSNCKKRRRKCDETRPACLTCVQRGQKCGGYQRPFMFKDVSQLAAESSRKFEAARWSAIRHQHETMAEKEAHDTVPSRPQQEAQHHKEDVQKDNNGWSAAMQRTDPAELVFHQSQTSPIDMSVAWSEDTPTSYLMSFGSYTDADRTNTWPHEERQSATVLHSFRQDFLGSSPQVESSVNAQSTPQRSSSSEADILIGSNDGFVSMITEFEESNLSQDYGDYILDNPTYGPAADSQLSMTTESALILHFKEHVVPRLPTSLSVTHMFSNGSCFRFAVLALSEADKMILQQKPGSDPSSIQLLHFNSMYYQSAVRSLNDHSYCSDSRNNEERASTALLLAYYEMRAGSPRGVRTHALTLDSIAPKLDFSISLMPALLKAWRILRYDVRLFSMPTRITSMVGDDYDICSLVDPQLAVRDIFSGLYNLHGRYAIESPFINTPVNGSNSNDKFSAAKKATNWLSSILGRDCDHQQSEQGDFYEESLGKMNILQRCETYKSRLDYWYRSLGDHDHPIPQLGGSECFLTSTLHSPITIFKFCNNQSAFGYVIYLLSRIICEHLLTISGHSTAPLASQVYAQTVLGSVAGMSAESQSFTLLRLDALLIQTIFLCESIEVLNIAMDALIPRLWSADMPPADYFRWAYMKGIMELNIRERLKGKTIRFIIDEADDQCPIWSFHLKRTIVAFGDCSSNGDFRGLYTLDLAGVDRT